MLTAQRGHRVLEQQGPLGRERARLEGGILDPAILVVLFATLAPRLTAATNGLRHCVAVSDDAVDDDAEHPEHNPAARDDGEHDDDEVVVLKTLGDEVAERDGVRLRDKHFEELDGEIGQVVALARDLEAEGGGVVRAAAALRGPDVARHVEVGAALHNLVRLVRVRLVARGRRRGRDFVVVRHEEDVAGKANATEEQKQQAERNETALGERGDNRENGKEREHTGRSDHPQGTLGREVVVGGLRRRHCLLDYEGAGVSGRRHLHEATGSAGHLLPVRALVLGTEALLGLGHRARRQRQLDGVLEHKRAAGGGADVHTDDGAAEAEGLAVETGVRVRGPDRDRGGADVVGHVRRQLEGHTLGHNLRLRERGGVERRAAHDEVVRLERCGLTRRAAGLRGAAHLVGKTRDLLGYSQDLLLLRLGHGRSRAAGGSGGCSR
eukprot:PhM_4_TR1283/c1_g1_i2/m.7325